jgi:hypothetical protein
MSTRTAGTTQRPTARGMLPAGVAVVLAGLLLVVSLTTLGWLHMAANSMGPGPAVTLDFSDLRTLTDTPGVPTNTVQSEFFGWLAWLFVIVGLALGLATAATRARIAALALAGTALVTLVVDLFAVKGPLTWSAFSDQLPDIRLGAYFMIAGLVVLLAIGVWSAKRAD